MNILSQLKKNFDTFIIDFYNKSDQYCLNLISKMLEELDLELAATRRKSLIIIKKVSRTILTSRGLITFKRRYYYDEKYNCYTYLLDSVLKIPKWSRLSTELKIKILSSLDHLSYQDAGKYNLPDGYELSPVTVFNLLNKSSIKVNHSPFKKSNKRIHVQIDEKYISMKSKRQKASNSRVYTACIFTDIDKSKLYRHKLINRTIVSSRSLNKFFQRINATLVNLYGITYDDYIYISGDLASYIQNSSDRIKVCKAIYVPDKFHVQRLATKIIGEKLSFNDLSHFDSYIEAYINALDSTSKEYQDNDYKSLYKLLKNNSDSIKCWFNKDYLGCSQECINSHYFADRLDKKPNTFTTSSLDKLCDILNAKHNNCSFIIDTKESYYDVPLQFNNPHPIDLFDNSSEYYIDYDSYSYGVRKSLKRISGL